MRPYRDPQIAPDGFPHQPMGGTVPCLPQLLEAGAGLTVRLDARGRHIRRISPRLQERKLFATTIAQTVCDGSLFPVAEGLTRASHGSAAVLLLRRASHAEHRD